MERVFGGAPALPDESPASDSRPNTALPIAAPSSSSAAVRPVTDAAPQRSRRWLLLAAPVLAALFAIALAVRFALTLVPGNEAAPATGRTPPVAYSASAARPVPVAEPVPKLQAVERDIAVIVAESVTHAALMAAVRAAPTQGLLRDAVLFDIYRPQAGEKSMAVRLRFQGDGAPLTDERVEPAVRAVVDELGRALGARLRG